VKRRFLIAGSILVLSSTLACEKKPVEALAAGGPESPSVAPEPNRAGADAVELDVTQLSNIHVEQVRSSAAPGRLTATGKIQFNEDRTTRVLAPMPGQVIDLQVRVGDAIEKDQVLFSIKSREVASLVTDYLEAQRDLDLAEKTHVMTRDLFEHQAASRISLQQAEGALAKAKAQVARAEEALRVVGLDPAKIDRTGGLRSLIPVKAAGPGTVIERAVTPGQFVQADNTSLITVADLSSVWVLVDVFETDIHLVHAGQKVQVTAAAYPNLRFTAMVDRISDKVDPETRSLKVRLLVANPKLLLKPEMFITASLEVSDSVATLTVPAKAVLTEDDKTYLFVATGDRRFERRLVTAAPDGEGRLRVTSGLRSGEKVVSDGALLLNFRQKQQKQN
jgi:cobalt-zinc-cadmium efflux system membrane fusion protein